MTMRDANRMKKWMSCLKCGRRIYTDRCHRICPKCHQKNAKEGRIRQVGIGSSRAMAGERLGSQDDLRPWAAVS